MDPVPQPTGSVFPVRPSLDHLLAMGDDEDDNEPEGQKQEQEQQQACEEGEVVDSDITSVDPEQLEAANEQDATAVQVDQNDVDDDEPSEMTEPQQQPDAQQSTGSANPQQVYMVRFGVGLSLPGGKSLRYRFIVAMEKHGKIAFFYFDRTEGKLQQTLHRPAAIKCRGKLVGPVNQPRSQREAVSLN
ncbi:hypothetical protein ZHAS_00016395 [Anopheles sinensis]|uniref:Uncharacterized protein n=1 Tax=Anopheles sinensis TaxID=74873 RepID=A0A084WDA5_ANOSI|nr:hypothetical protein ZHAS_00016395 [Anopheles sinensis]